MGTSESHGEDGCKEYLKFELNGFILNPQDLFLIFRIYVNFGIFLILGIVFNISIYF